MSVGYALLSIEREGTPSTKLGPRMGMEATSLSRTLKSMEGQGLIERRQDEHDRRSVRVFLTEDGVKARRQIRELVIELNARLHELLGEDAGLRPHHAAATTGRCLSALGGRVGGCAAPRVAGGGSVLWHVEVQLSLLSKIFVDHVAA